MQMLENYVLLQKMNLVCDSSGFSPVQSSHVVNNRQNPTNEFSRVANITKGNQFVLLRCCLIVYYSNENRINWCKKKFRVFQFNRLNVIKCSSYIADSTYWKPFCVEINLSFVALVQILLFNKTKQIIDRGQNNTNNCNAVSI